MTMTSNVVKFPYDACRRVQREHEQSALGESVVFIHQRLRA